MTLEWERQLQKSSLEYLDEVLVSISAVQKQGLLDLTSECYLYIRTIQPSANALKIFVCRLLYRRSPWQQFQQQAKETYLLRKPVLLDITRAEVSVEV